MTTSSFLERVSWKTLRRMYGVVMVPAIVLGAFVGMAATRTLIDDWDNAQASYWFHPDGGCDYLLHVDRPYRADAPLRTVRIWSGVPLVEAPDARPKVSWWNGAGIPLESHYEPQGNGYWTVADLVPPAFRGDRLEYTVLVQDPPKDTTETEHTFASHPGLGRHNEVTFVFPSGAEVLEVRPEPAKRYTWNGQHTLYFKNLNELCQIKWRLSQ
jgi:hypothetical protein